MKKYKCHESGSVSLCLLKTGLHHLTVLAKIIRSYKEKDGFNIKCFNKMREIFCISFIILFLIYSPVLKAQEEIMSVSYEVHFIQGSSHYLSEAAGDDGLKPADFGTWLSDHASVQKTVETPGPDIPISSQFLFFVIDRRGAVLSQNSLPLQVTENSVMLRNSLNANELSRTLNSVFINQNCKISGSVLISGEKLFPGGFLIGSIYESQRLAANAASRAFSTIPGSEEGFTLFLMAVPDIDEFDYSVDPGVAAFLCMSV